MRKQPPSGSAGPLLIAVDAAVQPASLAVMRAEEVACQQQAPSEVRTDAWLAPAIDECLDAAGLSLDAISGFAVTTGPGMFTGIRVGLATCLGLAAPRSVPVAGVLTLEALAAIPALQAASWIAPCIDARRGQVYGALYRLVPSASLPFETALEPMVADPWAFIEAVSGFTRSAYLIGTGVHYFDSDSARQSGGNGARVGLPSGFSIATGSEPLAASVGRLVARGWTSYGPSGCRKPVPLYLRPADARQGRNPLLRRL